MMTMDREAMKDKLRQLMQHKFKLEVKDLKENMRLNEDLRIDSVMIVQLIVYLEVELLLQVPDSMIDPRAFATIGSLLDFMQGLEPLAEAAAGATGSW